MRQSRDLLFAAALFGEICAVTAKAAEVLVAVIHRTPGERPPAFVAGGGGAHLDIVERGTGRKVECERALGIGGYLGKFFTLKGGPVGLFVGVLEFFLELVKPVTLAMRLFGNIYGGELALTVMTTITLAFIPLALYGLELFVGLMQGIIFSVLVLVFTMLAMEGHHEEGHDEHHEPAGAGEGSAAGAESRVAAH